jgi:hypothetical protein
VSEVESHCGTLTEFDGDAAIGAMLARVGSQNGVPSPIRLEGRDERQDQTAEVRLMIAVLTSAIQSYLRTFDAHTARRRIEFNEVQSWFNARNQPGLFSFENVCTVLGIDGADMVRSVRMLARQKRGVKLPDAQAPIDVQAPIDRWSRPASSRRGGDQRSDRWLTDHRARPMQRQAAPSKPA